MSNKINISILGTRGIPNQYGGFEQFAEILSVALVSKGMDVTVYNPHYHQIQGSDWHGVHIINQCCPPKYFGALGQFIYDLNCILHIRRNPPAIIYQLGYTSSSVWYWLHPRKTCIITNMDGMEWSRSKYNLLTRTFLKYAEKLAVIQSNILVADSIQIKNYLKSTYGLEAQYIPYGSTVFHEQDETIIRKTDLEPNKYFLMIARFQPDNNIETIIGGYLTSGNQLPLVLVGDYSNRFGKFLRKKYHDKNIHFKGQIFDKTILNNLRYYSAMYFHGHSAGGTNPSLLEAMGAGALICAHDNAFNREVLGENSFYFNTANDISEVISSHPEKESYQNRIQNNRLIIENKYNWASVIEAYQTLFLSYLNGLKS